MKNLVIVESPAKAKTISNYLGKDFEVMSSYGHIRDLPSKGMAIDIENNFEPTYAISPDKKKVVAELKKAAKSADLVWLASDEDREGEAIAWHLVKALDLKKDKVKRIVFSEITKPAISEAVKNPRDINEKLVDAQQARRVLDRLVGYELSPVIWRKIKPGLSAGRVQSVAVRLIVEREREIKDFKPENWFELGGIFKAGPEISGVVKEKHSREDVESKLKQAGNKAEIVDIIQKPGQRSPSPPFTTSTLQQEASRALGFSVRQTMTLAQRLYEAGHITYMRTDSLNISALALKQAKQVITDKFGAGQHKSRQFKTKQSSAQEAHEAIRPTKLDVDEAGSDARQKKLYKLIWQRMLASQMVEAKILKTSLDIKVDGIEDIFKAEGEVITESGWLKLYPSKQKDKALPEVKKGQKLDIVKLMATEKFSRFPARYTEASLVKKLEELGIGRPSTYAPTISTIQARGYVVKQPVPSANMQGIVLELKGKEISEIKPEEKEILEKNKLTPTDIGTLVNDFLVQHFVDVLDYAFTADLESQFDKIAIGDKQWQAVIKDFYGGFHEDVEKTSKLDRKAAGTIRHLGDSQGQPVYARYGRFGPIIQLGDGDDKNKPKFAPIPDEYSLQDIDLKTALSLLAYPKELGKHGSDKVSVNIGPYGPYISVGKKNVPLGDIKPSEVDLDKAVEVFKQAKDKKAKQEINKFGKIVVKDGRYGPYVTDGKTNASIPKDIDPKTVDKAQAEELLEQRRNRKKK